MAYALRYDVITPALLREMAILRTGQILNSEYELDQHIPLAKACGMTDAQIAALPDWHASSLFDEKQRALLGYTEAVALHGGDVDDATYAAFAKILQPAGNRRADHHHHHLLRYRSVDQGAQGQGGDRQSRSAPPKC